MRVAVASDHGGFLLKKEVVQALKEMGQDYYDYGTYSDDSVDYPDFALKVAESVASGEYQCGIICCGTGIGVSIAANKVPGIRAALCHDTFSALASREHNDANVLTMGQRVIGPGLAREIVKSFLAGEFTGGRHARRVGKIAEIEKKYSIGGM